MEILTHPFTYALIGVLAGTAVGFLLRKRVVEGHQQNIKTQSKQIIENAIVEAEQLKKEALLQSKEEAILIKQDAESELKADRDDLREEKRQVLKKESRLKKNGTASIRKK